MRITIPVAQCKILSYCALNQYRKVLQNNLFFNMKSSFCSHDNTTSESHYDIVVTGGGMVGFAAACALGKSTRLEDRSILLLETQPERSWKLSDEYSNRVCALNSQTRQLFFKLGAWNLIEKMRAQPVKKMQVWESCSEAMITFDHLDSHDTFAYIVENDVILGSLKQAMTENVQVSYGSKVSSYVLPSTINEKAKITFEDGRVITTDLLVGADGANSGVRKTLGCKYLTWEYDQMGIVATLELSEEQDNNYVAWQKFLSTGPVALLPLSSTRSSLVWSTTKQMAKQLLSLPDIEFIDALNNAIWDEEKIDPVVKNAHAQWQTLLQTFCPGKGSLGAKQLPPSVSGIIPKSRAAFPLGLGHAAQYVGPRVALVGDAAHRVHPLAGQGVNLGFGDVEALLSTIENAVIQGTDIGDERELHRYETCRQRHNVVSMAAIDTIYRLYSTNFLPVVLLRSLGLSTVDVFGPLKRRIMAQARG